MTRDYAKRLAEGLTEEGRSVLRLYVERKSGHFSLPAVNEVIRHGLIQKTTNLITGKEIWVLTRNGKKVARFL